MAQTGSRPNSTSTSRESRDQWSTGSSRRPSRSAPMRTPSVGMSKSDSLSRSRFHSSKRGKPCLSPTYSFFGGPEPGPRHASFSLFFSDHGDPVHRFLLSESAGRMQPDRRQACFGGTAAQPPLIFFESKIQTQRIITDSSHFVPGLNQQWQSNRS